LRAPDPTGQWLVSVPQMQKIMEQFAEYQQVPEVAKSLLELEQAKAEDQQKRSKNRLGINLLRFRVDNRDNDDLRLGFMVGVNVPLGTETFQTTQSHHDLYDASVKYRDSVDTASQDLDQKRDKMAWLLKKWLFVQKQMDKLKERSQKEYATANPKLALALQLELSKKLNESAGIQQEAFRLYLSYLAASGQLAHQPLRNWLHNAIPELHPMAAETAAHRSGF